MDHAVMLGAREMPLYDKPAWLPSATACDHRRRWDAWRDNLTVSRPSVLRRIHLRLSRWHELLLSLGSSTLFPIVVVV